VGNSISDWFQALLTACQGREIQLKMLITRGESVQRNTSAEGVPVVRKQIQDLKDSWESLLSTSIQCKRSESFLSTSLCIFILCYTSSQFFYTSGISWGICSSDVCVEVVDVLFMCCIYSQLEGALSHWTSYQEDVSQFECWMQHVEESLGNTDKHYAEMRDKTANLGRAKANWYFS